MDTKPSQIKVPGPAKGYTELLDEGIKKRALKEQEEKKKTFNPLRPSSAGRCSRELAYALMEYRGFNSYNTDPISPELWRLFDLGNSVEYSAIRNFRLLGPDIVVRFAQQMVSLFKLKKIGGQFDDLIEGSCDGVFFFTKQKSGHGIFDVKSQKDAFAYHAASRWQGKLEDYDDMPDLTKLGENSWFIGDVVQFIDNNYDIFLADNIYQLNAYGYSQAMQARGIDHCVLYKYNKNDSKHYELRWAPSKELYFRVQQKFNRVNAAVAKKNVDLIARPFSPGHMRCAFCNYNKHCWPGEAVVEKWLSKFKDKDAESPTPGKGVKDFKNIQAKIASFEQKKFHDKTFVNLEKEIVNLFITAKVKKLRLDNERVYEIKKLKSQKDLVLRRVKVKK